MAQVLAEEEVERKQAVPAGRAGFAVPAMDAAVVDDERAEALEKEKKKKRAGMFLELLAACYGVTPAHFDSLTARDGTKITPFFNAYAALNQPRSRDEALVARNDLGSQTAFEIRLESVMIRKGEEMTMTMAIDMALAAKANPAFAKGVDVVGSAEERAMLLAAAELVGLTVLNEKSVKANLLEQYRREAARQWEILKEIVATREQLENEETEASAAVNKEKSEDDRPLPVAQAMNTAAGKQEPSESPAEKAGETKPVESVAAGPEKDQAEIVPPASKAETASAAPAQNLQVNITMPSAEKNDDRFGKDAPPVAAAFEQAKEKPLPIERKKPVAEILEEGRVPHDLYALVRYRVIQDNDARVRHVEDIIGLDNNIEGSTKKARVILKALEAEGVVVQDRPRGPRRVVRPADGQMPLASFGKPGLG